MVYCSGCKQTITSGLYYTVNGGPAFHDYCFKCCKCRRSSARGEFYMRDGFKLYCKDDYLQTFGDKCKGCGRAIQGQALRTHNNDTYHRSCFKCKECSRVISMDENYVKDGTRINCLECASGRIHNKTTLPNLNGELDDPSICNNSEFNKDEPSSVTPSSSDPSVTASGEFSKASTEIGVVKKIDQNLLSTVPKLGRTNNKSAKKSPALSLISTVFRVTFDLLL